MRLLPFPLRYPVPRRAAPRRVVSCFVAALGRARDYDFLEVLS